MASRSRILSVDDSRRSTRGAITARGCSKYGVSGRGFLGVQLTPLTPELRVHFGVPEDTGVMVARVEESGPAEAAGILVGDILSAIDGERIDSGRQLSRAVRKKEEGDVVTIELYRDGSLESYPVTVGERERPVIDLARGFRFMTDMPAMDDFPDHDVVIAGPGFHLDEESMEAFEQAMRGREDHFDSVEWQEKLERVEELDFTAIPRADAGGRAPIARP